MSESSQVNQLIQRFQALPRAFQWGLVAVGAVLVFLVADSTTWALARHWTDEADQMESAVEEIRQKERQIDAALRTAVIAHGPVRMPLPEPEGAAAMAKAVNEALTRYKAIEAKYDSRATTTLPADALRGVIAPNQQAARVVGDVSFKAKPADVAAIIAEIESSPDVDAISRLTIEKSGKDMVNVRVTMTVESWVIRSRDARRRGRA